MALFGFICLVIFAIYVTVATLGGMWVHLGFSGKIPLIWFIFVIFTIWVWYLVFNNAPFTITMK